ncbi:Hypothetical protein LUCI_0122 [Lucifera butyrica]|uniref:Uridine phosphorylase n=1 Tax=Lucifera butyrica TaxID=1351585 RepID=A0A498QXN2_9FIRM|nr:nucleoside phosphorylase [Lucifera butyrica]VBB04916.1 Hypothetical protein LUCI_0122 [Lucifera butyrica]
MEQNTMQPHIRCSKEVGAAYAILPGDPQRIDRVLPFLDNPAEISYNREFRTAVGFFRGIKVMITSTGIGGPSLGIAAEELGKIGVETLIRIGSCGALQPGIKLGDLIIPAGAVRDEGTSATYIDKGYPAIPDPVLMQALLYCAEELGYTYHCGRIRSHDSFYTDIESEVDRFWGEKGILASDMETAPLFVIGGLRNLKTASVLNVVVEKEGELEKAINSYVDGGQAILGGEEKEIRLVLEMIYYLEQRKRDNQQIYEE